MKVEPIIDIATIDEAREAISNDALCKKIGSALIKAYPSRRWYVRVFDHGRVATIILYDVNTEYGNTVKMLDRRERVNIKKCIMAGGEALERFNLTRSMSDNSDVMSLQRNTVGNVYGSNKGEYVL